MPILSTVLMTGREAHRRNDAIPIGLFRRGSSRNRIQTYSRVAVERASVEALNRSASNTLERIGAS